MNISVTRHWASLHLLNAASDVKVGFNCLFTHAEHEHRVFIHVLE